MSESINDGGSAFPVHANHVVFGGNVVAAHEPGMSLRDWFAGQALAHIGSEYFANGDADKFQTKRHAITLALHAYNIADAMLAARLTERK